MALSRDTLFADRHLNIRHVHCRCECPGIGELEEAERDSLVFVLGGYFTKHLGPRHSVLAGPSTGLFFAASRPYRVSHPGPLGDDCLVLQHSPAILQTELISIAGIEGLQDPRLHSHSVLPLALVAVSRLLAKRLRNGMADTLEVSETAAALLAVAVRSGLRAETRYRTRPQTRARRLEQVHAAQAYLLDRPEQSVSLQQVAEKVGASAFHLARIFRQHVGMPLYEFQLHHRLYRATVELLDTGRSLAEIGLDYGFASHSHFSHAFTQRTGTSPTRFRELAGNGRSSQVSKIVKALKPVAGKNASFATCD